MDPADLLILPEDVATVRDWIERCGPRDVLVITQDSSGCGVSTMLRSLERDMSSRIAFLSPDDPPGTGTVTVLRQKKIVLIDPLDEALSEQTKHKRASAIMESRRLPIIVAGIRRRASIAKVEDAFGTVAKRRGVTRLRIPTPETSRAVAFLARLGIDDAEGVWERCAHDFRHCIASTQVGPKASSVKDLYPDGLEALSALLGPPAHTYQDAVRMADGDINLLLDGVFENYVRGIGTDRFGDANDVLEVIAMCDRLQNCLYSDPSSEFPELGGLLAGVEFLPVRVTAPITKHGTVWAKENHKFTKAKMYRQITPFLHPESIAYVRQFACRSPEHAARLVEAYGSSNVWNATRLWMKTASAASYTRARHEKAGQKRARGPAGPS